MIQKIKQFFKEGTEHDDLDEWFVGLKLQEKRDLKASYAMSIAEEYIEIKPPGQDKEEPPRCQESQEEE